MQEQQTCGNIRVKEKEAHKNNTLYLPGIVALQIHI